MNEPETTSPAARLRSLLAALVRAALMSDEDGRPWLVQAQALRNDLLEDRDALATLSSFDGPWSSAVRDAEAPASRDKERRVSMSLPKACPIGLPDILDPGFEASRAAAAIRASAATG